MANHRLSPWMYALLSFLSDGEWQERRTAIDYAARFVPPGVALRRREQHNRRRREKHHANGGRVIARQVIDLDDELLAGRRQVVRDSIYGATSVEREGVRLRITDQGRQLLKNYADAYGELVRPAPQHVPQPQPTLDPTAEDCEHQTDNAQGNRGLPQQQDIVLSQEGDPLFVRPG